MTENGKIKTGVVVSDKMDKTVVVRVDSVKTHPIYKKQFVISKNFKVEDSENKYKVDDQVVIKETKPYSKGKAFKVIGDTESVNKAK